MLQCIMLENGQTHYQNLVLWTLQDCESMFGYFSTLYMTEVRPVSDFLQGSLLIVSEFKSINRSLVPLK